MTNDYHIDRRGFHLRSLAGAIMHFLPAETFTSLAKALVNLSSMGLNDCAKVLVESQETYHASVPKRWALLNLDPNSLNNVYPAPIAMAFPTTPEEWARSLREETEREYSSGHTYRLALKRLYKIIYQADIATILQQADRTLTNAVRPFNAIESTSRNVDMRRRKWDQASLPFLKRLGLDPKFTHLLETMINAEPPEKLSRELELNTPDLDSVTSFTNSILSFDKAQLASRLQSWFHLSPEDTKVLVADASNAMDIRVVFEPKFKKSASDKQTESAKLETVSVQTKAVGPFSGDLDQLVDTTNHAGDVQENKMQWKYEDRIGKALQKAANPPELKR